jgi:integrase
MGLLYLGEPLKWGSLHCQRCNNVRYSSGICPKCGYDLVSIRIAHQGTTYRFPYDKNLNSFTFRTGSETLARINDQKNTHTFDPSEYLASNIKEKQFGTSFEKWLLVKEKECQEDRLSFETLRKYRSYFRNHFENLKMLDIRDITLKDFNNLLEHLSKDLSLNYKRRLFECLHSFYGWLFRWGTLKKTVNEFPIFPMIEGDDAQVKRAIPYREQVDRISRLPEKHRDVYWFMREEGLREGEVCVVKVGDLDIVPGRVMVQRTLSGPRVSETTKQKKKQTVPLSRMAQDVANRNRQDKLPGAFLLLNPDTHRRYSVEYLRKLWKRFNPDITLYEAMRHSTISDWALHGTAYQVQMNARHTDQRTTQKYVHEVDDELLKLVNREG